MGWKWVFIPNNAKITEMIIQHTANGQDYLIVQVPKDSRSFTIDHSEPSIDYTHDEGNGYILLPSGQYEIMFVAEEATIEYIRGIMDLRDFLYIGRVIKREFTDHDQHKHLIIKKIK